MGDEEGDVGGEMDYLCMTSTHKVASSVNDD
jgi:hypothetical protein